jgi:hypothetical protein
LATKVMLSFGLYSSTMKGPVPIALRRKSSPSVSTAFFETISPP